jgi:hypothetical protein
MKKLLRIIVLLALLTGLSAMGMHKYYVAVFRLDHVPEKKVLQMTSRIFIDDLEAALSKKYKTKFYFGDKRELPAANDYLKKYLIENIAIKVNGRLQAIKFLGREIEDDILICYYTIPAGGKIKTVEVRNTSLFETFPDQQNIIHTNINRNKKSLLLTNDNQEGILEF